MSKTSKKKSKFKLLQDNLCCPILKNNSQQNIPQVRVPQKLAKQRHTTTHPHWLERALVPLPHPTTCPLKEPSG